MGLQHAQSEVRGMISTGLTFDAIEARISRIPGLADVERSALWLYAWSSQDRGWQRREAGQMLEWVANGG